MSKKDNPKIEDKMMRGPDGSQFVRSVPGGFPQSHITATEKMMAATPEDKIQEDNENGVEK